MRTVSYFSGGIPSAVATKLALTSNETDKDNFLIYNFEIKEEHPDKKRFLKDCEEWFQHPIITVGNDEYGRSCREVFRKTRFLVGPRGARCTGELKKAMRWEVGKPTDRIVMGYTREEANRIARLHSNLAALGSPRRCKIINQAQPLRLSRSAGNAEGIGP